VALIWTYSYSNIPKPQLELDTSTLELVTNCARLQRPHQEIDLYIESMQSTKAVSLCQSSLFSRKLHGTQLGQYWPCRCVKRGSLPVLHVLTTTCALRAPLIAMHSCLAATVDPLSQSDHHSTMLLTHEVEWLRDALLSDDQSDLAHAHSISHSNIFRPQGAEGDDSSMR
jgi:hypothetical protein